MSQRLYYYLAGVACGTLAWSVMALALRNKMETVDIFIFTLGGELMVMIGERTGRIPPVEEEHRLTTLFPDGIPGPK
jgi:hypothetical protein